MRRQVASTDRSSALRNSVLSLAKTCSMGLRSAVGREEEELGADTAQGGAHGAALVATEIIHNHDVAGLEGRDEELSDVGKEALTVDGSIEDARGGDAIVTKGGQEGHGRPVPVRHLGVQWLATPVPTMAAGHVGLGPRLVDEDQPPGIDAGLVLLPPGPPTSDVRAILFAGEHGFF